jgi:hypothetical protein
MLAIPCSFIGGTGWPTVEDSADAWKRSALKVFLDCRRCDDDYIRTEITFVNYVIDRKEAQVHLLITSQRTASGGREYTLFFIGQADFSGKNDTLLFNTYEDDTDDIRREKLVKTMKLGLVSYVSRTPLAEYLSVNFDEEVSPTAVNDKWDSWVFDVSLNSWLSSEEHHSSASVNGNVSADRVTPELRVGFNLYGNYHENLFTIDDSVSYSSYWRGGGFEGLVVKSISDHWSIGGWCRVNTSSYANIKQEITLGPAIEYNLFPYKESTRRELRFIYLMSYNPVVYMDTTIFNKTSERLLQQSFSITLEMKEKWGEADFSFESSQYFHDRDLYRVGFKAELELQLFKGFSLDVSCYIARINDQLSLLKRDFSTEEILLGSTQLATDFSYWGSIGVSYHFGSIYSNVVNPRFGY